MRWRTVVLYPPGHFYSPLTDFSRLDRETGKFSGDDESAWECVDLNPKGQLEVYTHLLNQTELIDFPEVKAETLRYFARNDMFVYGDAFTLSGFMQRLRPRRVIEIGSGFSSAVMLDTADACGLETHFTFVEIHPKRLRELLRPNDIARVTIDVRPVQEVPHEVFDTLQAGDILFIDSSHVAKVGSDLTHLILKTLPRLRAGVYIHIHDMFYPESYPLRWQIQGRAWNESLFVRAFLHNNHSFSIRAFNAFASSRFKDLLTEQLPRFLGNPGGSLWLEKVQ